MKKIVFILYIFFQFLSLPSYAVSFVYSFQSEGMHLQLEKVADGFGVPWAMAFLSENKLLITEREGFVRILDINSGKQLTVTNSPKVLSEGQGGLLDVALSPDYKKSGWIYFTYVKAIDEQGATVLARAQLNGVKFSHWQDLLITQSATDTTYHFGSRIAFDDEGHVFFGIGDRGQRPNAQNLMNHAGTIIRLNRDGSIPTDNPFFNQANALPEIWSYGHRNPQGLFFDHTTKLLWSIEHGPRGGDEINLIKAGANYGWPVISYGKEYWGPFAVGESTHKKGMEQPVKTYIPSIAPGSLMVYSSNTISSWKGNLFSGALKLQHINRVVINASAKAIKEERLFKKLGERIRTLAESPEGWIYFSTDSGKVYRIRPESSH